MPGILGLSCVKIRIWYVQTRALCCVFFAMHVHANVKEYLVTRVLISRLEFPEHQALYPLK